jgi:hypothetical protein
MRAPASSSAGREGTMSLYDLPIDLIVFPRKELDHLLDVGIQEINALHLAGGGPHADTEIHPANATIGKLPS